MNIKRYISLLIVFALLLGCFSCQAKPAEEDEAPVVFETLAPTPTPEPEGFAKVFGKEEIKISVICEGTEADNTLFAAGILSESEAMGMKAEFFYAEDMALALDEALLTEADLIIVNAKTALEKSIETDKTVVIFDHTGSFGTGADLVITQDNSQAITQLYEAILAYPPHDTPVRLLAMFESEMTAASEAFAAYMDEGKFMYKGTFAEAESEDSLEDWANDRLERYFPGMIDALIAENESYALHMAEALKAAERDDFEIFSCVLTEKILGIMQENPELIAAAIGTNDALAGKAAMLLGLRAISGEVVSDLTLVSEVFYAAEFAGDAKNWFMENAFADAYENETTTYLKEYFKQV
ncbi:MAG: hypothetical protein IKM38_05375 [Christensenellaceae bacterium]|nr:hypothetical protein [Christensenellaceae bacterium]